MILLPLAEGTRQFMQNRFVRDKSYVDEYVRHGLFVRTVVAVGPPFRFPLDRDTEPQDD